MTKAAYIGRFAPSPTGSLHFGSLLTALASYLDAKANQGVWRLRIDDIDPPRQRVSAIKQILDCLETLNLLWDDAVIYQSQRYQDYINLCEHLIQSNQIYPCYCSRKKLARFHRYPGFCQKQLNQSEKNRLIDSLKKHALQVQKHKTDTLKPVLNAYALRLRVNESDAPCFTDKIQGTVNCQQNFGDFIVLRRDSLPGYMLACAHDDFYDAITNIVRGSDLLESTCEQLHLQNTIKPITEQDIKQASDHPLPEYAHIPVITNSLGQKLSKQHHAPEIDVENAPELFFKALVALGQQPPTNLRKESHQVQLQWGIEHWQLAKIPLCRQIDFDAIHWKNTE